MKISDFLRDDSPYSSMRVAFWIFTMLFVPSFVAVWVWLCIRAVSLVDVPAGITFLIMTVLGGKVAQKGVEVYKDVKSNGKGGDTSGSN